MVEYSKLKNYQSKEQLNPLNNKTFLTTFDSDNYNKLSYVII